MATAVKKTTAQKSTPAQTQKAAGPSKVELSNQLMTVTVPAKETDHTLIVPKSVNGKERWFAKADIKGFKKDGEQFVITATRREFQYRGMEGMAKLA